jgi:hypothetical protein
MEDENQSITLTKEQIAELNRQLAQMRHSVNNNLALITAAVEMSIRKPEIGRGMLASMSEFPQRISREIHQFSDQFEKTLGINKPQSK